MSFLINPFAFAVAGGDFEAISSVTVGSGGASSIQFTSIPSTFAHLQVRMLARSDSASNDTYVKLNLNGDTTASYAWHLLRGDGSNVVANGGASSSEAYVQQFPAANRSANIFGAAVVDILDYSQTSKNTTIRDLGGYDSNGAGSIWLNSNLWADTSAIASIDLVFNAGDFVQYSTAALYGVKAP